MQGILIVIWKINRKSISGIFIAVNVVDTVTNFGQVRKLNLRLTIVV